MGSRISFSTPSGEARELGLRERGRRQRQRHDRTIGVVELLDDRLLHLRREIGALGRDRVAQVLRGFGEILRELELDDDLPVAVVRLAVDVLDAADRGDLLFHRIEDFLRDAVG
jgi:hypothetical protein